MILPLNANKSFHLYSAGGQSVDTTTRLPQTVEDETQWTVKTS